MFWAGQVVKKSPASKLASIFDRLTLVLAYT